MALTIAQMRVVLLERYSWEAWKIKVNRMPDDQVYAVYRRLVAKSS